MGDQRPRYLVHSDVEAVLRANVWHASCWSACLRSPSGILHARRCREAFIVDAHDVAGALEDSLHHGSLNTFGGSSFGDLVVWQHIVVGSAAP